MAESRRRRASPTQAIPLYQVIEEEHRALHENDPDFKDPLRDVASLLRFDPDQIIDAPDIARKLNEVMLGPRASRPPHPRDPVCAYLMHPPHRAKSPDDQDDDQRTRSTAAALRNALSEFLQTHCVQGSEEGMRFRLALADRLNDLIYNERPGDHESFHGLPLNPYAEGLMERRQTFGPRDAHLYELNRLLIEAAFPTQLQRLRDRRLENVYRSIRQHEHAALCLSGGGIRSATFGLGVIQGLAHHRVLGAFDYLSTVSGGGYVGSWLTAWMAHAGPAYVEAKLRDTAGQWAVSKLEPEPTPIRHLRAYSNFLSPRVGLLSADTWTLVATFMRNILLNWLVLVPLMAAVTAVPWIVVSVIRSGWSGWPVNALGVFGLLFGIIAIAFVHDARPEPVVGIGSSAIPHESGPLGRSQREFIVRCFLPLVLSGILLTTAWGLWLRSHTLSEITQGWRLVGSFIAVGVLLHGGAWGFAAIRNRRFRLWEAIAAVVSGGLLGFATHYVALGLAAFDRFGNQVDAFAYATLGLPSFLIVLSVGGQLFLGLVSRRTTDAEREWGARFNAWLLIALVAWLVVAGIVLFGPWFVQRYATGLIQQLLLGGAGAGSAVTAMSLASGNKTSGKPSGQDEQPKQSTADGPAALVRKLAMALALPLLVASILVVLSALDAALLTLACQLDPTGGCIAVGDILSIAAGVDPPVAVIVALVLFAGGWGLGRLIDTNKFSLHAMYRARLIRAFLGASRPAGERHPDRFTGFDDHDNLRMWQLWPAASAVRPLTIDEPSKDGGTRHHRWPPRPPLPVINLALNVVSNPNLAWQERKATSFTVTPLHAGSLFVGYRRTSPHAKPNQIIMPEQVRERELYGEGISLGTAITISGAAASPNAGYHSSPLVTFLMTLFNARLGAWLGNPGPDGERTFADRSPRLTAATIIAELFGFTNDRSKYVYLSDGGHFDNLGLYEMVLRRCRFIVVSDAGCDADCTFEDLGNAIRRIRIDLGIPIEFDEEIPIYPRSAKRGAEGRYWAVGRIKYSAVDRPPVGSAAAGVKADAGDGTLIYIKPAFYGVKEPRDVYNYARTSETFPHEATADQFYSESQFESYRALGRFVIDQICANEPAVTPYVPTEPERESDPLPWLEFRARRAPKPPESAADHQANGERASVDRQLGSHRDQSS